MGERVETATWLLRLALPLRWSLVSAAVTGTVGAAIGLILGLRTYPPTAWFAVIEVGLPAVLAGAVVGLVGGAIVTASHRAER